MTNGKKHTNAETITFAIIPYPNHSIIIGAIAITGIALDAIRYGRDIFDIKLNSAIMTPNRNPITEPIKKPNIASAIVTEK
jgi:hypothetical protein